MVSIYALLAEFPSTKTISDAHLICLSNILVTASKRHYNKSTAITFRDAVRPSIGSHMPAKSLELKHTIHLIQELDSPDKILAYAGLSPSTYQSGQLELPF